jgi:hypothetical protein
MTRRDLTLTQEAIGTRRECASTNSGRRTLMLVTTGLWVAATGIVALSLESFGVALALFGLAGWLLA